MLKLFQKNKMFSEAEKYTSELPIDIGFAPKNIYLSVSECSVSVGDTVRIGQSVGKSEKSSPVCSGISGKVAEITQLSENAFEVRIENDFLNAYSEDTIPFGRKNSIKVTDLTPEILTEVIKDSCISTHGRQITGKERTLSERILEAFGKAKQIVINCVSGDPYDTAADRALLENPSDIINGMKILMAALGIGEGVLVLDTNCKEQAEVLSKELSDGDNVKIILTELPYPSDNEHLVMYALTSIELSASKNAEGLACAIFDWREVLSIGRAFVFGEKETCETVTVSGDITDPMNANIPYGTKFSEISAYCNGSISPEAKIIVGGLLRGKEVSENDVFESGMAPIVFVNEESIPLFDGERCIRCGECARVCPMMLMPMYINLSCVFGKRSRAKFFDIDACIECGACQYVCPSEIPILGNIRKMRSDAEEAEKSE